MVWRTRREDILPQPYHWYTFTGAPQVYNGLVVVGNGGAEWPTRGFVEALDAQTGKLVWRFNITAGPDDPNRKRDARDGSRSVTETRAKRHRHPACRTIARRRTTFSASAAYVG